MKNLNTQIERFIKFGFKKSHFTQNIYQWLHIETNQFIAHGDRNGFYNAWFSKYWQRDELLNKLIGISPKNKSAKFFVESARKHKVFSEIYWRNVAHNYASSFAVAIRNLVDPSDGEKAYLQELPKRLVETIEYSDSKNISRSELCDMITEAVKDQLEWVSSGGLDRIRDQVKDRSKK